MKIYIFTNPYPAWSQTFIHDEIVGLENLSHEIRIVALSKNYFVSHPSLRRIRTRNVSYVLRLLSFQDCIYHVRRLEFWTKRFFPSIFGNHFRFFGMKALADLVRREKPDLFLLHFGALGEIFIFLKKEFDFPYIVFFHGDEYNVIQRKRYNDYKESFSYADQFLVKSKYSFNKIVELGCKPDKVAIIPFGINPDDYPFRETSSKKESTHIQVVGIGRLVENKDFGVALEAIQICWKKHPALRYSIIGDGPLRSSLEERIRSLGLEKVCSLVGWKDSKSVSMHLSRSDIYLQPVRRDQNGEVETFGNTLLEAQLHGLPVVSTDLGGIPEVVIHNETGLLAPESDAETLAKYLLMLIENQELRTSMGEKGRQNVLSNFNSKNRILDLERILRRLALSSNQTTG